MRPRAAEPLSPDELLAAGVFWLDSEDEADNGTVPRTGPSARWKRQMAGAPVMVTRLHVRYTPQTFPEDLMFQETGDRENFQARYVLRRPWRGRPDACPEAKLYFDTLARRQEKEAQVLSSLTGWDIKDVRARMELKAVAQRQWWERLWR